MPSRQGHTKSRHGCTRCKARKVKCNLVAPCGHCRRRKEPCSLVARLPPSTPAVRSPSDPDVFLARLISSPAPGDASEWGDQLYLMSHFATYTVHTLTRRADMLRLWQCVIPQDAVRQPFLLHGMLALSALHLASQGKSGRHRRQSCYHQNEAIAAYRVALNHITPDSAGPIYAMSYLTLFTCMAAISDNGLHRASEPDVFKEVMTLFVAIRGTRTVMELNPDMPLFLAGPYGIGMQGYKPSTSTPPHSLCSSELLWYERLRRDIDQIARGEERETFTQAIDALERTHCDAVMLAMEAGPDQDGIEPASVLKWIAVVPSAYVQLLQSHHSAALLVLGAFAGLVGQLGDAWYLTNWTDNVLGALKSIIDVRVLPLLVALEERQSTFQGLALRT